MTEYFDSGDLFSTLFGSGPRFRWRELSEQHGFLLLAPNAVRIEQQPFPIRLFSTELIKNTKGRGSWNDGRVYDSITKSNEDDVGFLVRLIDWAVQERNIDADKVFVAGPSNGGMMIYRLLIERSDLVKAAAAFVANLPVDLTTPTALSHPRPIFIMVGTADAPMPYEGGLAGPRFQKQGSVRSSIATRDYFLETNSVGPEATTAFLPDLDPNDGCRIWSEIYQSSSPVSPTPVHYYEMQGGGHVIASRSTESIWFRLLYLFLGYGSVLTLSRWI